MRTITKRIMKIRINMIVTMIKNQIIIIKAITTIITITTITIMEQIPTDRIINEITKTITTEIILTDKIINQIILIMIINMRRRRKNIMNDDIMNIIIRKNLN